jgi:hypothetical protein
MCAKGISDHQPPNQVISSTEQQQQQQQEQIVNLTNKVNEMQAIMRRLETQQHQQPALDSQVFYPTEQQQQEQQQKPLILSPLVFRRGCPHCLSYLLSTREEMDKHIDDCRTIDQKPVVKKEEPDNNLDINSFDSLTEEAVSLFPLSCFFCEFIANTFEENYTHLTTSHPEMWMSESNDTDILQIPIVTLTDDSDDSDDSDEKSMPSTSWRQHNSFDIQFPPPPPPSSAPPPPPRPSSANYKENHCRRSSNNNTATTTTTTTTTNTTENKSSTSTSTNTSSTSRNSTSTNTNSTRSSSSTSSKSFKNKLSSNSQHFDMLVNRWKKNPFFVNVESDAEQLIPVADSADSKSKSANSESTNVNMQQQEKHVKEKKKTGNLKRQRQKQQQQSESFFKKQKK